jgi:uncharacterized membrane-anchored protein YhcB (DUF1043 family)
MKKHAIILMLFASFLTYADNSNSAIVEEQLKKTQAKVQMLDDDNKSLKNKVSVIESKLNQIKTDVNQLTDKTDSTNFTLNQATSKLGLQITNTESAANTKIQTVDKNLSKNTLLGIIGILLALLLTGILYWLLSKRQLSNKSDIEKQLTDAKKTIDEEQIQLSTKLAELYNGQMELLKSERKVNTSSVKVDHSLPLKVADEIVKMQMNLAQMDSKIRGHRQLSIAVTNVFDNFKANGYEIVDYLNKPFNEGMNMQATMEPDPLLKEGEQVIRRIIKPEVHFNNKVIQNAQVIVAFGE